MLTCLHGEVPLNLGRYNCINQKYVTEMTLHKRLALEIQPPWTQEGEATWSAYIAFQLKANMSYWTCEQMGLEMMSGPAFKYSI